MISLNLVPALRLLAHLAPDRAVTVHQGELPSPDDRTWSEPPDPAEFAPLVPRRFPLAVEVMNHRQDPDDEHAAARPRPDVTAEVWALLLAAYPDGLPETARELLGQLAFEFVESGELARLTVAAEPGGHALDELHLVARDYNGDALVLSPTAPVASVRDPVDVLADISDVLGEYVWLSNNDRLRVTVKAEAHGLTAVTGDAFADWWPTSDTAAALLVDLWDEEPESELQGADTLAAFRDRFTAFNLDNARGGAWAAELIGDYDVDDDPQPRFPGDRLVEVLTGELLDGAAVLAGNPVLVYGLGLPDEDHEGFVSALLFAGPERVVVLTFDAAM